jgi:ATP-binding protein involved in chromosome partitioning
MMDGRFIGHLTRQLLRDVDWGPLDILLIDLPPGTAEPHATLARERLLHGVIVVTTPQAVAQIDAGRFMRFFEIEKIPVLGAVLNMSFFECPDCGARHAIWPRRDTPRGALRYPILAEIPIAPAIAAAGDGGRPVVVAQPDTAPAQAFQAAARRLWELVEEMDAGDAGGDGAGG